MAFDITALAGLENSSFIVGLIFWELIWKGFALWRAGRRNEPLWFFAIFILNTLGILPIIYLIFSRKEKTINSVTLRGSRSQLRAEALKVRKKK
jgi:hypothetical protein